MFLIFMYRIGIFSRWFDLVQHFFDNYAIFCIFYKSFSFFEREIKMRTCYYLNRGSIFVTLE